MRTFRNGKPYKVKLPQEKPGYYKPPAYAVKGETVTVTVRIPKFDVKRLLKFGFLRQVGARYELSGSGEHAAWRGVVTAHEFHQDFLNNGAKSYWEVSFPTLTCCVCGLKVRTADGLQRHLIQTHGVDIFEALDQRFVRRVRRQVLAAASERRVA